MSLLYNVLYTVNIQQQTTYQYNTVLIYCCALTVYNTLYKFVTTQRDGLYQILSLLFVWILLRSLFHIKTWILQGYSWYVIGTEFSIFEMIRESMTADQGRRRQRSVCEKKELVYAKTESQIEIRALISCKQKPLNRLFCKVILDACADLLNAY